MPVSVSVGSDIMTGKPVELDDTLKGELWRAKMMAKIPEELAR